MENYEGVVALDKQCHNATESKVVNNKQKPSKFLALGLAFYHIEFLWIFDKVSPPNPDA